MHKIKIRIQSWRAMCLNLFGRVTLIKSVLSSLPVYLGSGLLPPKDIIHSLSSLIVKFLLQGRKNNENKCHLVNWKMVRQPKNIGALAIKDHEFMNLVLGAK